MKILVACEFSGAVRSRFREKGYDAWSCDLRHSLDYSKYHIRCNVLDIVNDYDCLIAFPPCQYLSNVRGSPHQKTDYAIQFFISLLYSNPKFKCIENPVQLGYVRQHIPKYDQIVNPFMFGDPWAKRTCLWLRNLPRLKRTSDLPGGKEFVSSRSNKRDRSLTFPGIADAMVNQWSTYFEEISVSKTTPTNKEERRPAGPLDTFRSQNNGDHIPKSY